MGSYYQSFNNRKLLPASLFVRARRRKIKWIAEDHSATRWQRQEQNCNLLTLHPAPIWTGKRKSILEACTKRERFVFTSAGKWAFSKGAEVANVLIRLREVWKIRKIKFWKRLNDCCIAGKWLKGEGMCLLATSFSPWGIPPNHVGLYPVARGMSHLRITILSSPSSLLFPLFWPLNCQSWRIQNQQWILNILANAICSEVPNIHWISVKLSPLRSILWDHLFRRKSRP